MNTWVGERVERDRGDTGQREVGNRGVGVFLCFFWGGEFVSNMI